MRKNFIANNVFLKKHAFLFSQRWVSCPKHIAVNIVYLSGLPHNFINNFNKVFKWSLI